MSTCLVFNQSPQNFLPKVEIAACYIVCDNKILFLQRPATKKYNSCWAVPAGKLEPNETPHAAVLREVKEETSIELDGQATLNLGILYMRLPHLDYVCHLFYIELLKLPLVRLNEEHQNFVWVTINQTRELNLMPGAAEALKYFEKILARQNL